MLTENPTLEAPLNPAVAIAKKNYPQLHATQCAGQEKDGKYIICSSPIVN